MKLCRLDEIFDVSNGNGYALNAMSEGNIRFIARGSKNNGIGGYVQETEIPPFNGGAITVALSGSVLESFYQDKPFYTSYHIKVLRPKKPLSAEMLLVYCAYIKANKYRYSYGRQANKTLEALSIPALQNVVEITKKVSLPKAPSMSSLIKHSYILKSNEWEAFRYDDIFHILNGYYNKKPPSSDGGIIPFIGATEYNNGITSFHTYEDVDETPKATDSCNHPIDHKLFEGRKYITISNNGSVGYAFYQPVDFTCTHDVNVVTLKGRELTPYIAMFLCTLINQERYRWAYGRKWRPIRMPKSIIKLPVDKKGLPDWDYMEDYIKGLPYSANLAGI